ncbi:hypothetical protein PR202_ga31317 [Eleusine coracana subsp. coracana]|uniref:Uncharacterized protein n=1 Tax=Eleusine coracana subsp. coracana TaxID=191504 RepID=A0AAV5DRW6_ELECO|nr:hypothetical protein PR202_ga31317 [Eleusine coracana subsp. coracana]
MPGCEARRRMPGHEAAARLEDRFGHLVAGSRAADGHRGCLRHGRGEGVAQRGSTELRVTGAESARGSRGRGVAVAV